ncbi:MAG: hypothetical protein SXG53_22515 [Pseudomonadota bacterium]|nr:hypothetical protein [Pseudomonadota bacterium]
MSLFRHSAIGLGVSLDHIAAAVPTNDTGSWRVQSVPLPEISRETLTHVLDSLLQGHTGSRRRVHSVFAPETLREWVMDVPAGVQSLAELRTLATARFTQLYGLAPDAWTIAADWTPRGPMLCTAAPTGLLETLGYELARRGLKHSVSTMLCRALSDISALPNDAWLCIRTHRSLSLLLIRGRSLQILRTLRTAAADQSHQLETVIAEMNRARLRSGFTAAQRLHWYDCSQGQLCQTAVGGVEIVPISSRILQRIDSVASDADSCAAACMGAVL